MKEEPAAAVERLIKTIETMRKKQSEQNAEPLPVPAKVIQLPLLGDDSRGTPNEILRSALFNARNRNQKRQDFNEAQIVVIGEGEITYTGKELRQDDQIVWLQLIHSARTLPAGELVKFKAYSFIKALGWSDSTRSYKRLRDCLTRMQATALSIYSKRLGEGLSLSMIPFFRWRDGKDGPSLPLYEVRIAPELVTLFGDVFYATVEWKQRLALPEGLATWLHGYFASHKKPYPIKLETIREGSGSSKDERLRDFKVRIKKALQALVKVSFLESWEINGDLVSVRRA